MNLHDYLAEAIDALSRRTDHLMDEADNARKALALGHRLNPSWEELEALCGPAHEALIYFKRLAAVDVMSTEDSGVSDMGFPRRSYVSFAAGRHQEYLWRQDDGDWMLGRTPEPEEQALCLLAVSLECKRRNGGAP